MKEYKMNFATKTLTITKAFAEAALDAESEASTIIANCRAACPDLRIVSTALLRTFGASTFFMGFFSIRSCFSA